MNTTKLFLFSSIVFIAASGIYELTYAADPYFAFEESFALSQRPENARYPIVSFIPRTMLMYIDDRNKLTQIGGRTYLKAATQDGAQVFVDSITISKGTFREVVGTHEIIFNSAYGLCRDLGCNNKDPDQIRNIHAGDAFKIRTISVPNFHELHGTRLGEEIVGYIRDSDLENLTIHGVVTRADRKHPKYTIAREESKSLGTEYGETVTKGTTKKIGASIEIDLPILKAFGIGIGAGAGADMSVEIKKSYGGDRKKYLFSSIRSETIEQRNHIN